MKCTSCYFMRARDRGRWLHDQLCESAVGPEAGDLLELLNEGRPSGRCDRQARMDRRDRPDRTEPALANEQTESTEANEPTESTEANEPAEPMDRMEPADPTDRASPAAVATRTIANASPVILGFIVLPPFAGEFSVGGLLAVAGAAECGSCVAAVQGGDCAELPVW